MHITLCVKIEIKYLPMLERAVGARLRVNTGCTSRCAVYKRVSEDNLRYNRYEEKAQVLMLEYCRIASRKLAEKFGILCKLCQRIIWV